MTDDRDNALARIQDYYNSEYYRDVAKTIAPSRHHRNLVKRLGVGRDSRVLDVACGTGEWIRACQDAGAVGYGVDLSERAIAVCRANLAPERFHVGPAEKLPFDDDQFDLVTCFGSLEHFVVPGQALAEMVRVARPDAGFVFVVPNADFLTRKLGLYRGTNQVAAREEVRTIEQWDALFEEAGLVTTERWRDLHVLSWHWIKHGSPAAIPIRLLQALLLVVWPLRWQYQIYFKCRIRDR